MTTTGLKGPFSLDVKTIDKVVTKKSAGTYALGYLNKEGLFVPKYVGRSDTDINKRLKDSVGNNYPKFEFEYYGSPKAAFEKECNLYHDWKAQLDNKEHPDRPENANWKCPRCKKFNGKK